MPRVIEKTVYRFDELSEKAKDYARKEYVEQPGYPHGDWYSFDDFIECAKCLGIEIGNRRGSKEPAIFFSGFWSQGDGASFVGTYECRPDAVEAITKHASQDEELRRIAEEMTRIQVGSKFVDGGSTISVRVTQEGRYVHSGSMCFDIYWTNSDGELCEGCIDEGLEQCLRDFADWMYKQLEQQHDSYFENDYIDECLQDHEFDEDGAII